VYLTWAAQLTLMCSHTKWSKHMVDCPYQYIILIIYWIIISNYCRACHARHLWNHQHNFSHKE
jgi:hypothetical protein